MKDESQTVSTFSEKKTGLGPCPSSKVYFSIFNWWLFIDFSNVWNMNSGPFTGETNASPSSWGVRQNSFHGNSCGGLQYSPELPPLLGGGWGLSSFRQQRGLWSLPEHRLHCKKGSIGHRHEPCFWFCKKRLGPYLQERFRAVYCIESELSPVAPGISCKKHAVNVPGPIPRQSMFLWLIWGIQLPKDQSWVPLPLCMIQAYRNSMDFVNFNSSDTPSSPLWLSTRNFRELKLFSELEKKP